MRTHAELVRWLDDWNDRIAQDDNFWLPGNQANIFIQDLKTEMHPEEFALDCWWYNIHGRKMLGKHSFWAEVLMIFDTCPDTQWYYGTS